MAITVPAALLLRVSVQKVFRRIYKNYQNAQKMAESSYYCLQYFILSILATTILFREKISWLNFESLYRNKIDQYLSGEPNPVPSFLHRLYLKFELTIYFSAAIFMVLETRKDYADFWMTVVHHIVTISLITAGYSTHNFNYSVVVAHMHDISDIVLEFSKTVHYSGNTTLPKYTFLLFTISFIIPRCIVFPLFCFIPFWSGKLDHVLGEMAPTIDPHLIYNSFERTFFPLTLCTLYVLDLIWAAVIVKMCYDLFRHNVLFDVREKQN